MTPKVYKFSLVYQNDGKKVEFGELIFNGKYIFQLNDGVDIDAWDKFGIISVDRVTRRQESDELFPYINARLPIHLRNGTKAEKIEYIKANGLKVPSDSFYFEQKLINVKSL